MYLFHPEPAPGEPPPSLRELPALLASRFPSVLLVFAAHRELLGETAFLRYRKAEPIGSLAPAYFEAISMGILGTISESEAKAGAKVRRAVTSAIQSDEFREVTGPGANTKEKLRKRIEILTLALRAA